MRSTASTDTQVRTELAQLGDGVNRRVGILASLVTAHPRLAAVIQALVTPWPAEQDDTT